MIGAVPPGQTRRGEGAVLLPAGALLLLYTDGLVETRTDDLDSRIDTLASTLAALDLQATPEQVCDALIVAMGHQEQSDDTALLALRIDPPAAAGPATPSPTDPHPGREDT